jgi:predicted transposase/invertase (TIGR01784 family)
MNDFKDSDIPRINAKRYVNIRTDWGFKYTFLNKKYLIHYINQFFRKNEKVKDVTYLPTEQLGRAEEDRKAIFDIYFETDRGDLIVLEMQNSPQIFFRDRVLFYSTFPIRSCSEKGDWDYRLKKVYIICLLNFVIFDDDDEKHCVERVSLMRERMRKPFSDKLTYIFIELPKFRKNENRLKTTQDAWLFLIKNIEKLEEQPPTIPEKMFCDLFNYLEINKLKREDMEVYAKSDIRYEDIRSFADCAKLEGKLEGKMEGRMEGIRQIAKKLLDMKMPVSEISQATGLTPKQIIQL